jgi:hypothetical protein
LKCFDVASLALLAGIALSRGIDITGVNDAAFFGNESFAGKGSVEGLEEFSTALSLIFFGALVTQAVNEPEALPVDEVAQLQDANFLLSGFFLMFVSRKESLLHRRACDSSSCQESP